MPEQTHVELRFSAHQLANMDHFSLSDPFIVCHSVRNNNVTEEIGRTETILDDLNPVWTTTINFTVTLPTSPQTSTVLAVLYDRDSDSDRSLGRHDFLGAALFSVHNLLSANYNRLDIPLTSIRDLEVRISAENGDHPPASFSLRSARKVKGSLSVTAEILRPGSDLPIVFRVSAATLSTIGFFGRTVTQFYELQREREEANGETSWSCVYRSEDGTNVDSNNYVIYDEMCVTEQQLHNMQPDRRLRLAFFRRRTRSSHELISYVITSVADVLRMGNELDQASIPLQGLYSDQDGLGYVILSEVQRVPLHSPNKKSDRFELQIHLRADHFLHHNFVSSLHDPPRAVRRVRPTPKFIHLH